jgi:hypothetical protein
MCTLLGYYAASCGNCLPMFRDNVSVPSYFLSSDSWPLKMGPICCPEKSLKNYHTTPCNIPEECRSHQHNGGSLKSRLERNYYTFISLNTDHNEKCCEYVVDTLKHTESGTHPTHYAFILHIMYTGHIFHYNLQFYYSSLTDIYTEAADLMTTTIRHFFLLLCCTSGRLVEWAMLIQWQANTKFEPIAVRYNNDPAYQTEESQNTQVWFC